MCDRGDSPGPALTEADRRAVDAWSRGEVDEGLIRDELLQEIFERTVDAHPDRPAAECAGEIWTYAELEGRANRVAHFLKQMGVERGEKVAFSLPRSGEVYVAMLGALKCEAAYV